MLTDTLPPPQLRRITVVWIVASCVVALLAAVHARPAILTLALLVGASVWLVAASIRSLRAADAAYLRNTFLNINAYALVFCCLLVADAVAG